MNNIKKGRTNVDFIRTEVELGTRDGEVVVNSTAKLQLEKLDIDGLYDVWKNRFPFVSRNGVFNVSGKAVCGDEPFDFEKGKNMAETRAQRKAYAVAERIYDMIVNYLEEQTNMFKTLSNNCHICEANASSHIVDLDA